MIQVREAANKIYQDLYNIGFTVQQQCDLSADGRKCLIRETVMERALDGIQHLCDSCAQTADRAFNNLVRKALGAIGPNLYYYYQGGTRYIDFLMYRNKFLPDIQYIFNVADFFRNKYVMNQDCYLVMLESENKIGEMLQFLLTVAGSSHMEVPISMSVILFQKGDLIKVKRALDKEYTSFRYDPQHLISSLCFSVVNNKISGRVDYSKWEDFAWNL